MLLESIDQVEWPGKGKKPSRKPPKSTRATTPASPVDLTRSNDISVDSTPAPQHHHGMIELDPFENIDPSLRNSFTPEPSHQYQQEEELGNEEEEEEEEEEDHKPEFVRGNQMDQIKLGDVPLSVGKPYWFMHQGNYEHVWTVDSIRYVHLFSSALIIPFPKTDDKTSVEEKIVIDIPLILLLRKPLRIPTL